RDPAHEGDDRGAGPGGGGGGGLVAPPPPGGGDLHAHGDPRPRGEGGRRNARRAGGPGAHRRGRLEPGADLPQGHGARRLMLGTFFLYAFWSFRNGLRSKLRRLRQPRYLVGGAVGVAWFALIFGRQFLVPRGQRASFSPIAGLIQLQEPAQFVVAL